MSLYCDGVLLGGGIPPVPPVAVPELNPDNYECVASGGPEELGAIQGRSVKVVDTSIGDIDIYCTDGWVFCLYLSEEQGYDVHVHKPKVASNA